MYVPPEEKKPLSKISRWVLRLILVGVFIFLSFLFVVNTISGTGDMQRSGLQQALSDVTGTKVNITKLTQFNVFPQFAIGFEGIDGVGAGIDTGFSIGEFTYAKSFWDWFLNNETSIQKLDIVSFKANAGVFGPQVLEITKAGIVPAKDKAQPYLSAEGLYGTQKFSARFDLAQTQFGIVPGYEIGKGNDFDVRLGDFHAQGKFFFKKNEVHLKDATLSINDGAPIIGEMKIIPVDKAMTGIINFTAGVTKGQLTLTPQKRLQVWKFDRLHLDQAAAENSVWHTIKSSWHELVPPVSKKPETDTEPTRAQISINVLEGALSGEKLDGEFLLQPEGLVGRWKGDLKDQGKIECALLDKKAVSFKAGGDIKNGTLALNEKTGKITYAPAAHSEKLKITAADGKRLNLEKEQGCAELMNVVTP